MPDDSGGPLRRQIPPNLRLIRLMEIIAEAGVPLSTAELARALDLPKPTVHRLLNTAENEQLLQRDIDGKSFGPGRRLRQLATHTLSSERMRTERLAILRTLADAVGETCNISIPGRSGMVYLERVETHWPLRIQLPIGTKVPFNCTASGKMFLSSLRLDKLDRLLAILPLAENTKRSLVDIDTLKAELAQTRLRGYSTDDEEFMDGMAAIAVPVTDDKGRLLSTLSIHAPLQRHTLEQLKSHLDGLRKAAGRLQVLATE